MSEVIDQTFRSSNTWAGRGSGLARAAQRDASLCHLEGSNRPGCTGLHGDVRVEQRNLGGNTRVVRQLVVPARRASSEEDDVEVVLARDRGQRLAAASARAMCGGALPLRGVPLWWCGPLPISRISRAERLCELVE